MNILFLTLSDFNSIGERNIYTDLLREFVKHGDLVSVVSPAERKKNVKTHMIRENHCAILKLRIGNIQKTNILEKGLSTLLIEPQFICAVRKYFPNIKFDLVLYSTPPITFCKAVKYVKKRDHAKTYLLLKDIFPQNAVDLGMLKKRGLKKLLYFYFRHKEKILYQISDTIGCMSQANVEYLLAHNPGLVPGNVKICPNSIEPVDMSVSEDERKKIRSEYNLPQDKTIFVYGGNLGKPQGVGFMLKCLHSQRRNEKAFFIIIGNGTEYPKIQNYIETFRPANVRLHQWLPKEEYDKVIAACDVGMIFLDHRFTIPNFPSRLLGYMAAKLPVLAVTDTATDIGNVIEENGFGWWCESDDIYEFKVCCKNVFQFDLVKMGENAFQLLNSDYNVRKNIKLLL